MDYPVWHNDQKEKITCIEKIKVMEEGLDELLQMAEDLLGDGVLMGISQAQLKGAMAEMMQQLKCEL